MARFNYTGLARRAHKIMGRFGRAPGTTYLRRTSMADREVVALEADFSPGENPELVQAGAVRYLLSVFAPDGTELSPPPDQELDSLVLVDDDSAETVLVLAAPPKRTSPGGEAVFWQLFCRER